MVDSTYQVFVGLDQRALEGGSVYIGAPLDNPETSPIPVYWDEARTVLAPQPLRTSGGYIVRDGTPANVFTEATTYSVRVRDRSGGIVYYAASAGGANGASPVTFPIPEGPPGQAGPSAIDYADTQEFTGSAGQLVFVTNFDFAPNGIVVVVGISRLRPSDFTTNPDTRTVTLATPLGVASFVTISAFDPSSSGTGLTDAPVDDSQYARQNGEWVPVEAGAGPEADTTIRPELAAPTGAALVATNAAGTDAVTRDLRQRGRDTVSVLDYIPTSLHAAIRNYTSTTDIAPFASAAYAQNQGATVKWPRGRYYVGSTINTNSCHSIGDGYNNTMVYAAASGVTVFRLVGQNCLFRGFQIMGNGLGAVGIFCFNSNTSQIAGNWIDGFSLAGIKFGVTGNQNETMMFYNVVRNCGRRIDCGTATASAGASSISPSVNPTTLGIRVGVDFVKVGNASASEITAIGPSSISFFPPLETSQSGQVVKILQGSCVEIGRHGDNSDLKSINNTYQNGALAGIDDLALYGVQSIGDTRESNGYGRVIGRAAGGGEQIVIHWMDSGTYSENNSENAGIYHGSSNYGKIDNPVVDQIGNAGLDWVRIANSASLRAMDVNIGGFRGSRRIEYINNPTPAALPGSIMNLRGYNQPCTFTLITPTTSNARGVSAMLDLAVIVRLGDMGGTTTKFVATDGALINNVAGSTGVTTTKSFATINAIYTQGGTWEVSGL